MTSLAIGRRTRIVTPPSYGCAPRIECGLALAPSTSRSISPVSTGRFAGPAGVLAAAAGVEALAGLPAFGVPGSAGVLDGVMASSPERRHVHR